MKKAQGHVEMIMSFVIFAGFVFFIFVFFNPVNNKSTNYELLDSIETKIIENISLEVKSVDVFLTNPSSITASCFSINNNFGISENIVVFNDGNFVSAYEDGTNMQINKGTDKVYRLYSSRGFNTSSLLTGCTPTAEFSLGVASVDEEVFFENIVNLNRAYSGDYKKTKTGLGITDNFGFGLLNSSKAIIMNESYGSLKFSGREVLVRERPIKVRYVDGETEELILVIRAWV